MILQICCNLLRNDGDIMLLNFLLCFTINKAEKKVNGRIVICESNLIDHIVQEIILFSTAFLIDSQLKLASPIKFRVLIEQVAELFIRNPYPTQ